MHGGMVVVAAAVGGLVLHALNGYWGWLIAKKVADLVRGASVRGAPTWTSISVHGRDPREGNAAVDHWTHCVVRRRRRRGEI